MGGYSNVDSMSRIRRKRRRSASVSELWLVPLMERYYEPNKPAIVAAGLVLLPICIRFVLPSIEISRFVMVPLKESLPQVCDVMHTWLTPSMLFVLLNLVIGTIAVTSSRGPNNGNTNKKKAGNMRRTTFDKHGQNFEEEEEELQFRPPLVEPSRPKRHKFPKGKAPNPPVFSQKTHRFSPQVESSNPPEFLRKTHQFSPPIDPPIDPPFPPQFSGKPHDFSPMVEPTQSFSHLGMNKSKVAASNVFEVPHNEDMTNCVRTEDGTNPDGLSTDELNAMADNFIHNFKQQLMLQRIQSRNGRRGK